MSHERKDGKISRREMLRLTAIGAAALVTGVSVTEEVLAASQQSNPIQRSALAQAKVKLRIQDSTDLAKGVADIFLSKHSNVEIEFLDISGIDHEEVASKILSMVAAGQPLDLGSACTEATELYAGNGLADPLTDRVKNDQKDLVEYFKDVHPALIEALMYEGDIYQLGQNFNAANMYFNTKVLKDAGFEIPSEDWDKETFYKIAKGTTKKDASGQTEIFGYGWTNRLWGSWMPWIFANNGGLLTEERAPGGDWLWNTFYKDDPAAKGRGGGWRWLKPQANHPNNVEALEFMVQLLKEGITPSIELGGGRTLDGFFAGGKLAMTPAGGFWAASLHNNGMAPDAFDTQYWPKWKSQRHQFGVCGKFLFKGSPNKDLGWDFIKTEVSPAGMKASGFFNPYILTTPTRRSMLTDAAFKDTGPKNWKVFYDTLDKHPDTAPIPAPPKSNPMTTIFTKYTGVAMTLEKSPKDALDAMQKDLEALFARK